MQPRLPGEVADCLLELATAYSRIASYPESHPAARSACESVMLKLSLVLQSRDPFTVGTTRDCLIVGDATSDLRNRPVAAFARRMYDEQIGALVIWRGIDEEEVRALLNRLSRGSSLDGTPLGLGAEGERVFPHARFQPLAYDKLRLDRGLGASSILDPAHPSITRSLWRRLASTAMGTTDGDGGGASNAGHAAADPTADGANEIESSPLPTPEDLATAITAAADGADSPRLKAVTGVLTRLVEQSGGDGADEHAPSIQQYLSTLISTLSSETLARIMSMEGDADLRRRFLIAASEGLASDALVALARAAAQASQVTISSPMLRMLGKLAGGSLVPGSEADSSLRSLIRQTAAGWSGSAEPPAEYVEFLESMSLQRNDISQLRGSMPIEPLSIVGLGLEADMATYSVLAGADRMMLQGDVVRLLDMVAGAGAQGAAATVRKHVLRPEMLYRLLKSDTADFHAIERIAAETGVNAADPLIDLLSQTDDRALRSRLLSLLTQMGTELGPTIVRRLDGAQWYVQRNLLELVGRLPELPRELNVGDYTQHDDARVRRAAYKLLLRDPAEREGAMVRAAGDADDDIVRLALGVAMESGADAVLPIVRRRFERDSLSEDLRAMCIRLLAAQRDPAMLPKLMDLARVPRRFLRRERLQHRSPEMLAAVSALATYWNDHPGTASILSLASASADPDIRNAAQGFRRGAEL